MRVTFNELWPILMTFSTYFSSKCWLFSYSHVGNYNFLEHKGQWIYSNGSFASIWTKIFVSTYVCTCVFIANEALRNTACSMEMLLKKKSRLKPTKSIHRLVKEVMGNKFVFTIYPWTPWTIVAIAAATIALCRKLQRS